MYSFARWGAGPAAAERASDADATAAALDAGAGTIAAAAPWRGKLAGTVLSAGRGAGRGLPAVRAGPLGLLAPRGPDSSRPAASSSSGAKKSRLERHTCTLEERG